MMMRQAVVCLLVFFCLLLVACSSDSHEGPTQKSTEETKFTQENNRRLDGVKTTLKEAEDFAEKAQKEPQVANASRSPSPKPASSANGNSQPKPVKPVVDRRQIEDVISKLKFVDEQLEKIKDALASRTDSAASVRAIDSIKQETSVAIRAFTSASEALAATEEPTDPSAQISKHLEAAQNAIKTAQTSADKITIPKDLEESSWGIMQLIGDWWSTVAIVLALIFSLVLLLAGLRALFNTASAEMDKKLAQKVQPHLNSLQKQQAEFINQIAVVTATQDELRMKLEDLQGEIRSVARIAREAALDGGNRRPHTPPPSPYGLTDQPVPKEEPAFPISALDYLGKMHHSSNVVRPDFQNGILVNDPDGRGELVLIRDVAVPDDLQPLFVVPRATQFQTKQDFYTYYEKYYDCAKPSAGDVWIIDPAVVSRVSGGWQLREKGVLEIR